VRRQAREEIATDAPRHGSGQQDADVQPAPVDVHAVEPEDVRGAEPCELDAHREDFSGDRQEAARAEGCLAKDGFDHLRLGTVGTRSVVAQRAQELLALDARGDQRPETTRRDVGRVVRDRVRADVLLREDRAGAVRDPAEPFALGRLHRVDRFDEREEIVTSHLGVPSSVAPEASLQPS
jgi:hypothetical protein